MHHLKQKKVLSSCEELQGGHGSLTQCTLALEQNATQVQLSTPLPLNNGLIKGHHINQKVNVLKKIQKSDTIRIQASLILHAVTKGGKWKSQASHLPTVNLTISPAEPMNTVIDTLLAYCESSYNDFLLKLNVTKKKPSFARSDVTFGVSTGKGKPDSNFSTDITSLQNRSLGQVYGEEKRRQTICETDTRNNIFHFHIHIYESTSEELLEEEPEYISRVSSRITHSSSHMLSTKRKLSDIEKTGNDSGEYTSRYCPRAKKHKLKYEAYSFMRKTVWLESGKMSKEWHQPSKEGNNGFIGSGLNKNVFQGHIGIIDYALAEYKTVATYSISNEENSKNLYDQMVLLTWDSEGGNINKSDSDKLQAIRYSDFLATPLITSYGNEVRFSGTDAPGASKDHIGHCVDAFAHHTIIDSLGEMLFVDLQGFVSENSIIFIDPQAHIFDSCSGHWDKGGKLIQDFLDQHKCNPICKRLSLNTKQIIVPKAPIPT
ncbi:hypothetical protein Clacol_002126 [Clathrus columnatus]|uniref:Alpha-type protein kinase domain-containing protein n=1 Tax=Clathrus columnatus TaxID=1419009 RepID=A0AAV5A0Z2_9AGAM|nr:hypothetical protein Clacol_002126 [Clathrus columnatus]